MGTSFLPLPVFPTDTPCTSEISAEVGVSHKYKSNFFLNTQKSLFAGDDALIYGMHLDIIKYLSEPNFMQQGLHAYNNAVTKTSRLWVVVCICLIFVLGSMLLWQYQQIRQLKQLSSRQEIQQNRQQTRIARQFAVVCEGFDKKIHEELIQGRSEAEYKYPEDANQLSQLRDSIEDLTIKVYQMQQERQGNDNIIPQHLQAQLACLNQQVNNSLAQLNELHKEYRSSEEIVADLSGGVCLIQGEYTFIDPITKQPLRYSSQTPTELETQLMPVSTSGTGRALLIQYTGTGFLVNKRGYILTNQHVTKPWLVADEYQHVLAAGYEPKLCMFRAFFGDRVNPVELELIACAENEDVALLKAPGDLADIPILDCANNANSLKVGQTVIVLGYPTGFDVMLARMDKDELADVLGGDGSFDSIAHNLARKKMIQPVATRGMCGRIAPGKIIYDAQTAIGGSGAPVLGCDGKVVAINTALLRGFSGSNFGIPIEAGLKLLRQVTGSEPILEMAHRPGTFSSN